MKQERINLPAGYWLEDCNGHCAGIYTNRYNTERPFNVAKYTNIPAMKDFAKDMNNEAARVQLLAKALRDAEEGMRLLVETILRMKNCQLNDEIINNYIKAQSGARAALAEAGLQEKVG